ncbi:P1 family peptidase, partial [Pseudonocardia lacus]|uniref:P1 family peptidase n=1 Tax=Pseudonocardia lacus TaxID=2835865 RepID=UPI0027E2CBAC
MRSGAENALTDVPGIAVGHAEVAGGLSGTTVVLAPPDGAVAGVDVRGGAPGTRETDLLDPRNTVQRVHAVVLSGGSAFGLAAADGVMHWLEERGRGFPVPGAVVPIVPAAVLFDL